MDIELRENLLDSGCPGLAPVSRGRVPGSPQKMNQALSSGVTDAQIFFQAGTIYQSMGGNGKGEQYLRLANRLNPHHQSFTCIVEREWMKPENSVAKYNYRSRVAFRQKNSYRLLFDMPKKRRASSMRKPRLKYLVLILLVLLVLPIRFHDLSVVAQGPRPGSVLDEAKLANRASGIFSRGRRRLFSQDGSEQGRIIALSPAEIKGRNTWLVWTGGDDRLWDKLTVASFGALDLPQDDLIAKGLMGSRDNRWNYLGLVNEPLF